MERYESAVDSCGGLLRRIKISILQLFKALFVVASGLDPIWICRSVTTSYDTVFTKMYAYDNLSTKWRLLKITIKKTEIHGDTEKIDAYYVEQF